MDRIDRITGAAALGYGIATAVAAAAEALKFSPYWAIAAGCLTTDIAIYITARHALKRAPERTTISHTESDGNTEETTGGDGVIPNAAINITKD